MNVNGGSTDIPDVMRISLAGFGLIGRQHARVLDESPELSLAAVVKPQKESRRVAVKMGTQTFATLDEMFSKTDIDGVVLATPTPIHVEPIAVSSVDADKLDIHSPPHRRPARGADVSLRTRHQGDRKATRLGHRRYEVTGGGRGHRQVGQFR